MKVNTEIEDEEAENGNLQCGTEREEGCMIYDKIDTFFSIGDHRVYIYTSQKYHSQLYHRLARGEWP